MRIKREIETQAHSIEPPVIDEKKNSITLEAKHRDIFDQFQPNAFDPFTKVYRHLWIVAQNSNRNGYTFPRICFLDHAYKKFYSQYRKEGPSLPIAMQLLRTLRVTMLNASIGLFGTKECDIEKACQEIGSKLHHFSGCEQIEIGTFWVFCLLKRFGKTLEERQITTSGGANADTLPTISKSDVALFSRINKQLPAEVANDNYTRFLSCFSLLEGFPSWKIFKEAVPLTWEEPPKRMGGVYAQFCHGYLTRSLPHKDIFAFELGEEVYDESTKIILLKVEKHVMPLTKGYAYGASLRRFAAHLVQPNLIPKITEIAALHPDEQKAFESLFFKKLEEAGYVSSGRGIANFTNWNEASLKKMLIEAMQDFIPDVSESWADSLDFSQFIKGAVQFGLYKERVSGFAQEHAIALFYHALARDERGVCGKLWKDLRRELRFCLTTYLELYDPEHGSQTTVSVIAELRAHGKVVLPVSSPLRENAVYSQHAFYLTLEQKGVETYVSIIDGDLASESFYDRVEKNENEAQYRYLRVLKCTSNEDALKNFIFSALMLRHAHAEDEASFKLLLKKVYEPHGFVQVESKEMIRVQEVGTCTVHNLKYALKALHKMDEREFGLMLCSLMIGVDALAEKIEAEGDDEESILATLHDLLPELRGSEPTPRIDTEDRHNIDTPLMLGNILETYPNFMTSLLEMKQAHAPSPKPQGVVVRYLTQKNEDRACLMYSGVDTLNGYIITQPKTLDEEEYTYIKNLTYDNSDKTIVFTQGRIVKWLSMPKPPKGVLGFVFAEAMRLEIVFDAIMKMAEDRKKEISFNKFHGYLLKEPNKINDASTRANPRISNIELMIYILNNLKSKSLILELFSDIYSNKELIALLQKVKHELGRKFTAEESKALKSALEKA